MTGVQAPRPTVSSKQGLPTTLPGRRTGCRSAAAEARGTGSPQKRHDLARRRRSVGTACSARRSIALGLLLASADHTGTVPHPAQRACGRYHAHRGSHPAQRAVIGTTRSTRSRRSQRAFRTTGGRTTSSTTRFPHHGRSSHTLHHGLRHAGGGTTGVQDARFA